MHIPKCARALDTVCRRKKKIHPQALGARRCATAAGNTKRHNMRGPPDDVHSSNEAAGHVVSTEVSMVTRSKGRRPQQRRIGARSPFGTAEGKLRPDASSRSAHPPSGLRRVLLVLSASVAMAVYGCNGGDVWQGPGPVDECVEYVDALRDCFGERSAQSMASSVRERASVRAPERRARLASECSADAARLRRSCR